MDSLSNHGWILFSTMHDDKDGRALGTGAPFGRQPRRGICSTFIDKSSKKNVL